MALTRIPYGGDVASGVLNDNFEYLDDRITDVGSSISTVQSNLASVSSTLNSRINTIIADTTEGFGELTTVHAVVAASNDGSTVTRTADDNFSIQTGSITFTAANQELVFPEEFRDTNIKLFVADKSNSRISYGNTINSKSKATIYGTAAGNVADWLAIGFIDDEE